MDSVDRRGFLKTGAGGLAVLPAARAVLAVSLRDELPGAYGLQAVPFTSVDITDVFWRPPMEANRSVSLQHCFERFEGGSEFSVSGDIGPPAATFLTEDTAWREFGVIEWQVR